MITEKDFTKTVIDLAKTYHWRVAHFRTAMTQSGNYITPVQADGAGFPDLVLVKGRRLLFCELKSENGRLSQAQKQWIFTLMPIVEVYVWKPSNWDEIVKVLAAEARP